MNKLHHNRENGLVFDPQTGKRFRVNVEGACLLDGLQQGLCPAQLIQVLMREYDLSLNEAERGYERFARQCRMAGLSVPDSSSLESGAELQVDSPSTSAA
ncbi:PqqD family protein [Kiritimatiellota bacterium B12222]|nr:PqqD family protein [Kiritimatiellota bacterium B12222]